MSTWYKRELKKVNAWTQGCALIRYEQDGVVDVSLIQCLLSHPRGNADTCESVASQFKKYHPHAKILGIKLMRDEDRPSQKEYDLAKNDEAFVGFWEYSPTTSAPIKPHKTT